MTTETPTATAIPAGRAGDWRSLRPGQPRARPLLENRFVHGLLGVAFLAVYWNVYTTYLSVRWSYVGLFYRPLSFWEMCFVAVGVLAVSMALPTRLDRPSSLILWLLFAFVYVPTMAQTLMIGARAPEEYLLALFTLTAAMVALPVATHLRTGAPPPSRASGERRSLIPGQTLAYAAVAASVVVGAGLLFFYRGVLSLADITNSDDVYASRFAAADITSGIVAYVILYYTYVIAPALTAMALAVRKYRWMLAPGLACFLITYMIDASKISLIIPLAMMVVFAIVRYSRASLGSMTAAVGAMTMVCGLLTDRSALLRFVADLVLFRSIAIPGHQLVLYYDLFESRGYTWWSNIRGFNLILSPPPAFASDARWPALGQIVGEEYYGFASRTNSNANLFASEGVAAAGPFGILVIAAIFAVYLRLLDQAAVGWDRRFVLPMMIPFGLALTNVPLATCLLSFGGAFWVIALTLLRSGFQGREKPA